MRNSVDIRPVSKKSFRKWRRQNPKFKDTHFLLFKAIMQHHNKLIVQHALETGEKIKLPIGLFYIEKKKNRRRQTDFAKTKERGKRIIVSYANTDGWEGHFKYAPKATDLKFSKLWKMVESRYMQRFKKSFFKQDNISKTFEKYTEKI